MKHGMNYNIIFSLRRGSFSFCCILRIFGEWSARKKHYIFSEIGPKRVAHLSLGCEREEAFGSRNDIHTVKSIELMSGLDYG